MVRLPQTLGLVCALLIAGAPRAFAVPLYYHFEAVVTPLGAGGPFEVGDAVSYTFLVDTEAASTTDVYLEAPYQPAFYATLIASDLGYQVARGEAIAEYGYTGTSTASHSCDICGRLQYASMNGGFFVYSGRPFSEWATHSEDIVVYDSLISDTSLFNVRVTSLTITPVGVPEPSTLSLLGVSLVLAFLKRWIWPGHQAPAKPGRPSRIRHFHSTERGVRGTSFEVDRLPQQGFLRRSS